MTTQAKTPAAVIVEKMIADNDAAIAENAAMIDVYLHELEGRLSSLRSALGQGNSASGSWVSESARHIEQELDKREALHRNAISLKRVLKAAQPAE